MKVRYALLLAAAGGAAVLGSAAAVVRSAGGAGAGDAITGTWTAEPATGKAGSAGGALDSFEGTFRRGEGAGHFTFAPRPEFVAAMRGLGYVLDDEKLYSMAVLDVSREFVRQLDALGYSRLELDDLLSLRIHGASPEFVRQRHDLGYERVSAEDLVSMRIHGISPEFVRRVQASRGAVSIERLVDMRIHGQDP